MTDHRLTWPEFRSIHSEDYRPDHYWQREADVRGEPVRLWHPTHEAVVMTFEPEV